VLAQSRAPNRLTIGTKVTRGLGAGGSAEIGMEAALESKDAIREMVSGADLVFVTAGMAPARAPRRSWPRSLRRWAASPSA
jgi:cell division protein FtsZ